MPASISKSISNLANQVAHLAEAIDRLTAAAEASKQQAPALKLIETEKKDTGLILEFDGHAAKPTSADEACPLAPLDEQMPSQRMQGPPAENLIATSIADLYDRLGGLLGTALQPGAQRPELSGKPNHSATANIR